MTSLHVPLIVKSVILGYSMSWPGSKDSMIPESRKRLLEVT